MAEPEKLPPIESDPWPEDGPNTQRFRRAVREETRGFLAVVRPWAAAGLTAFAAVFAAVTFLVTRASSTDLEGEIRERQHVSARVDVLEAAHAFDDLRVRWLGEQVIEIARATRSRLVPAPPEQQPYIMQAFPTINPPTPAPLQLKKTGN